MDLYCTRQLYLLFCRATLYSFACSMVRIFVNDGKPGTNRFSIGVKNHHIKQGVIGLPDGIGALGTMPVDEFVPVAKSRRPVLRKRHHCGTQMTHNPVNATI